MIEKSKTMLFKSTRLNDLSTNPIGRRFHQNDRLNRIYGGFRQND